MNKATLREVHRFWFGDLKSPDDFPRDRIDVWFERSDEIDGHIRETFGASIAEAAAMAWDIGSLSREEGIGLIVLFDQFPRNIFRESADAFAYDAMAREIARALLATGLGRFFRVERAALVLPFEHSEDVADQDYAVLLSAQNAVGAPESLRVFLRTQLDYATRHRDVIRKFGRFPHRNAALRRKPTEEEIAFLAEAGRGF